MKFWDYISKHMAEVALITIVVFALISMSIAFLCERPTQNTNIHITMDSTQIIYVKLINDSTNYVEK